MNYEQLKHKWSLGLIPTRDFYTIASEMGFHLEAERDIILLDCHQHETKH
jgi:hypothetical protein